jgi:hypothetical protein
MDLKEREKEYEEILAHEIDLYLEKNGDELITIDPMRTKEMQLAVYRQDLQQMITSESSDELLSEAIALISNQMPHAVA